MNKYLYSIFLLLAICFACDNGDDSNFNSNKNNSNQTVGEEVEYPDDNDYVENSSFTHTITIAYSGNNVTINNSVDGVTIEQNNGHIVVNSSTKEVEYILTGNGTNSSFKIYSDYKFKLSLDGITITNPAGPAINIQSGKTTYIVANPNTTNIFTDGSSYQAYGDEDMKGCIFSEGQLAFSGNGNITINANYKHAICSGDYIIMHKDCFIIVAKAASDAVHANDYIIVMGGNIQTTSVGEGFDCEYGNIAIHDGNLTLTTTGEKGHCLKSEGNTSIRGGKLILTTTGYSSRGVKANYNLTIHDGDIQVKTTGHGASEGIESKNILTINGGTIEVNAYDDCINAANSIVINGGYIYCYSSNNDGIDSNGTLTITGGVIISSGTTSPEEGFDCDHNTFKITGGIIIGTGGATSSPTSNVCTQYSLIYGTSGTINNLIHIRASDGTEVLTYKIPRIYSQMTFLFSSPLLTANTSYTVYTGGSISGGNEFSGYYNGGTYSVGTQATTFTTNSIITQVGSSSGIGGGQPGGWGKPGW